MHIEGIYTIENWKQEPYDTVKPELTQADVSLAFDGGLIGSAETRYLMISAEDGTATFVGQLRVTGAIEGRSGTFVMHESGSYDGIQTAKGKLTIVSGSGTAGLAGVKGGGAYVASHTEGVVSFANRDWQATPEGTASWVLDIVFG